MDIPPALWSEYKAKRVIVTWTNGLIYRHKLADRDEVFSQNLQHIDNLFAAKLEVVLRTDKGPE